MFSNSLGWTQDQSNNNLDYDKKKRKDIAFSGRSASKTVRNPFEIENGVIIAAEQKTRVVWA